MVLKELRQQMRFIMKWQDLNDIGYLGRKVKR